MRLLYSYSEKGIGKYNEDVYGIFGSYVWIIDGATDLFHVNMIAEDQDVYRVMNMLNREIELNITDEWGLEEIIYNAVNATKVALYKNGYILDRYEEWELPTFTIALYKFNEFNLDYYILGDCSLMLINRGLKIITDNRMINFVRRNREEVKKLMCNEGFYKEKMENIYKKTRMLANKENGYWIGSISGIGLKHGIIGRIEYEMNDKILMFSDGFKEYFDLFGTDEVDNSIDKKKLKEMISKLRNYEISEKNIDNKLRNKKSDDLTVILVEV